jgi:hypothetical protein
MRPIQGWTETLKPDYRHRSTRDMLRLARVAQLVEQRIENPRVGGSNPSPGTIFGDDCSMSASANNVAILLEMA